MKKYFGLLIIFLVIVIGMTNVKADDFTITGNSSGAVTGGCELSNGCWYNKHDMGLRLTFVDANGTILSGTNSVDYFSNESTEGQQYYVNRVIKNTNGFNSTYYKTYKKGSETVSSNPKRINFGSVSHSVGGYSPFPQSSIKSLLKSSLYKSFLSDSGAGDKYNEADLQDFYIIIEPIYLIAYKKGGIYLKMGTATEIAQFLDSDTKPQFTDLRQTFLLNSAYNMHLDETKIGFSAVQGINRWWNNSDKKYEITQTKAAKDAFIDEMKSRTNGYGMYVVAITEISDPKKVIENSNKYDYECPINVNVTECGTSSIVEPSDSQCLINNPLYSFNLEELSNCKIYCSETIQTDFNEFYNTFKRDNVKNNAILDGRYLKIKSPAKITITKTCYKSSESSGCPDSWKSSVYEKFKGDYIKRTDIKLNVDDNTYTLYDSKPEPSIDINETSKVVYKITYNYRMDPNINKYISIETGKDVGNNLDKAVTTIENENGVIMIGKANYGTYKYNLDLSSTLLNKYVTGSKALANVKYDEHIKQYTSVSGNITTITTNTYGFNNTIKINGNPEGSYNTNNLNFNCSYEKGCICPSNTVCDPVTCEPVKNPPCECNSECGCKDNKTCDPIKCPDVEKKCDPTNELCYVYRPISLTNPFPGIKGNNRTPGDNWNGVARYPNGDLIYYHGSITSLSDYYIKYNRGYTDYELYRESDPLYVIKLDGDRINAIRTYNDYKKHDYNDSDLECDENGEYCISKFLRGRAEHFNINLLDEESTCKDVKTNQESFNRCICRKGEVCN